MKWISRLYIIFVGIILALTVGFGISAYHPEPMYPEYPISPKLASESCYTTTSTRTPECERQIDQQTQKDEKNRLEHEKELKEYRKVASVYTRNTVFVGVALGSLFAIIGLLIIKKSRLVASGLLLAGVLTATLTRVLISIASIGVSDLTQAATTFAYIQFGIMILLSIAVLAVGFVTLKEE